MTSVIALVGAVSIGKSIAISGGGTSTGGRSISGGGGGGGSSFALISSISAVSIGDVMTCTTLRANPDTSAQPNKKCNATMMNNTKVRRVKY